MEAQGVGLRPRRHRCGVDDGDSGPDLLEVIVFGFGFGFVVGIVFCFQFLFLFVFVCLVFLFVTALYRCLGPWLGSAVAAMASLVEGLGVRLEDDGKRRRKNRKNIGGK